MDIRFQPQVRKLVKEGREVSRDDWLSLTEDNHLTSLDTFRRRWTGHSVISVVWIST